MTTLKLFNTLSRSVEEFKPIDEKNVRMYVCGVTPYDHAHIGHARVYVVFDVLYRLLKHLYPKVTYVRNFTDIDDKIIARAKERGVEPGVLAREMIASFEADMAALNVLKPGEEPRVSEYVGKIVLMIDALIEKDFAYLTPHGDVMYRTEKFPDFGKLARRDLEGQQAGARVAADGEKENKNDFVLWKADAKSATKMEQAFLPAEFGAKHFKAAGRPGWHIECSAMSRALLGDTFDIHGGGEDLQFPHHSCEIAQTEALTHERMSNFWMHVAFITVGGKKMSKSDGNFTYLRDVLEKYSPEAIRLWLLQTHYRTPVDFSDDSLKLAQQRAETYKKVATTVSYPADGPKAVMTGEYSWQSELEIYQDFLNALGNDLNTSEALAVLDRVVLNYNKSLSSGYLLDVAYHRSIMRHLLKQIGLYSSTGFNLDLRIKNIHSGFKYSEEPVEQQIQLLLEARRLVRLAKDWKQSDQLRDKLNDLGIVVEDYSNGTTTWRRK